MPVRALFLAATFLILPNLTVASVSAQEPQGAASWSDSGFLQSQLYFGLRSDDGSGVSEQEWAQFVADVVTPRFPDGLTILNAYGQSRSSARAAGTLTETTKLLIIVHPATDAASKKLGEIKTEYARRFNQDSVFHIELPARMVE